MSRKNNKALEGAWSTAVTFSGDGVFVFHVLGTDGSVMGQALLDTKGDLGSAILKQLYVWPAFRGRGVARTLVKLLFCWLDAHWVNCDTWIAAYTDGDLTDEQLAEWYARLGFVPYTKRSGRAGWIHRKWKAHPNFEINFKHEPTH